MHDRADDVNRAESTPLNFYPALTCSPPPTCTPSPPQRVAHPFTDAPIWESQSRKSGQEKPKGVRPCLRSEPST